MLKKAGWLIKEAALRLKYMTSSDCIFCEIIKGKVKSNLLYQSDKVVAFADVNPVAKTHILIVPKRHIDSISTVDDADSADLAAMFKAAQKLVSENKLTAFRLAFNGGQLQHVPHLHMHLLAGGKIQWLKL